MAREEILSQVRSHIEQAAALLRSLGGEFERAAWMVEDSAHFVQDDTAEKFPAPEVRWQDFAYGDEATEQQPPRNGTRD